MHDGFENGDRNGNLEEDPPDGMNIENRDYTITTCVKDRERPLNSSISAESQSISLKQRTSFKRSDFYRTVSPAYVLAYPLSTFFDSAFLAALLHVNGGNFDTILSAHVIK